MRGNEERLLIEKSVNFFCTSESRTLRQTFIVGVDFQAG